MLGNRWRRWQISDCYSRTATLCVSLRWLDPPNPATNKVIWFSCHMLTLEP